MKRYFVILAFLLGSFVAFGQKHYIDDTSLKMRFYTACLTCYTINGKAVALSQIIPDSLKRLDKVRELRTLLEWRLGRDIQLHSAATYERLLDSFEEIFLYKGFYLVDMSVGHREFWVEIDEKFLKVK
jgi:hypothetical protein